MITQEIKDWLKKLFAWWPWKRSTVHEYTPTGGSFHQGIAQEPMFWSTADRPTPQPGITSVIVEQERESSYPEAIQPMQEEYADRTIQARPSSSDESSRNFQTTSSETSKEITEASDETRSPSPTQEQQLAFLKYLVKRGVVNEGFTAGQEPEQYRQ